MPNLHKHGLTEKFIIQNKPPPIILDKRDSTYLQHLPSKVKEKSTTYLRNVQKIGKRIPTVKLIKRGNIKKKQIQDLSTAQKLVISFVYNYIWKRISNSFVDLITPSIVKPNQLSKITDYRNHVGFFKGTGSLPKTRLDSYLNFQTTSNHLNITEKVIEFGGLGSFNAESKVATSTKCEESGKINITSHSKSNIFNGSQVQKLLSNEKDLTDDNLFPILTKKTQIPQGFALKKDQQEAVNLECCQEKNNNNNNESLISTHYLETNISNKNVKKKHFCKENNPLACKRTLQNDNYDVDKEIFTGVIQDTTRRINDKCVENTNKYRNRKSNHDLSKGSKSNRRFATDPQIKTCQTLSNKKSNVSENCIDGQRKNEGMVAEDNDSSQKTINSLKMRGNGRNESNVSLTQVDGTINNQNASLDRKECIHKLNKVDINNANLQENGCLGIKEIKPPEGLSPNKFKIGKKQDAGNIIQMVLDSEAYCKSMINTSHDSSFPKDQNKKLLLQNKFVKINKTKQSKPSKSYKKKKRKPKKLIAQTEATKDIQTRNQVEDDIKINKDRAAHCSSDEYKTENTNSPVPETYVIGVDNLNKCLNVKGDLTQKYWKKEGKQDQLGLTEDIEIHKTNLIVFDTAQDEAQLLIEKQSFGNKIQSNLFNLDTVIKKENSHQNFKKSLKQMKNSLQSIDSKHSEIKSQKNKNYKKLKPATIKPWKINKDLFAESKNKTKFENSNGNAHLDVLPETNKKTLVDSKAKNDYFESKTSTPKGNELNRECSNVKQNLETTKKQLKENDNSDKTSECVNAVSKVVPKDILDNRLKVNATVSSSSRLIPFTHSIAGKNTMNEKKSELKTQSQDVRTSSGYLNKKTENLEKNTSAVFSDTSTKLESLSFSDALPANKNKTKNMASFQSPLFKNSKSPLKSTNKTDLENNDNLLTKTIADITQGLTKISGKEEFKHKMSQLLHNFTVTGQKQKANNIQKRTLSQESVIMKHEKEKTSSKTISQESFKTVTKQKSINSKKLNAKLKNHESLAKKYSLENNTLNMKETLKTNNVSGNSSVENNILLKKPHTKPATVSVRPALSLNKDTKTKENTTIIGETNDHGAVAKMKNTTFIISSQKAKTLIGNKSDKPNTFHKEVKQHIPVNNNLKNKELDRKVEKSTIPANNVQNLSKNTEMLRKFEKRRPSN